MDLRSLFEGLKTVSSRISRRTTKGQRGEVYTDKSLLQTRARPKTKKTKSSKLLKKSKLLKELKRTLLKSRKAPIPDKALDILADLIGNTKMITITPQGKGNKSKRHHRTKRHH